MPRTPGAGFLIASAAGGYAIAAGVLLLFSASDSSGLGHVLFRVGGPDVAALLYLFLGALYTIALVATGLAARPRDQRPGRLQATAWMPARALRARPAPRA